MAARSTWKGSIRLSLITIPIRVYPATNPSADVSFRQLHRKCKTPIQLKRWCPTCDEEVDLEDVVKGHETSKGQFVVVEKEDIERLRPESTHVIDISQVLDASTVDPILIERSYYLAPGDKTAGPSFAVLRDSISGRACVGYLALHGREYLVAVLARDEALIMYTLRTSREVRKLDAVEELHYARTRVRPEEMKLARQVLQHFETDTDLSSFTDRYQESLREMLQAKGAAEAVAIPEKGAKAPKVVDLMAALRESLNRIESQKKRPAKAGLRPRGRVVAHPSSKRKRAS
jgi:DNA end-binding protein Ku